CARWPLIAAPVPEAFDIW
nr:immunoglobulin heavy chain junction region [Macaca mulatta]MOW26795.1 immunoglobulin heavy chain junction region [Macaca mulatta]